MIDRLAIIGGSSVYIPEFIQSAISHNLTLGEVVLIGRPGPKLPLVARFCQRLMNKSGYPTKIVATTNLEEGIRGARYILNHIRVGGLQARVRDEKLPPRFGMIGDESIGVGGFSNAMRTLPVVLEIARRIEETNPTAILINLTNPMGILIEALTKLTKLTVIGVCDLPQTSFKKVAELIRVERSEMGIDYIGLNHIGWIQDVKVNGRSHMDRVIDRIEQCDDDEFDKALVSLFRMIPTKTVSMFYHTDEILKRQIACNRFRAEVLSEAEKLVLQQYEDNNLTDIPSLIRQRNAVWYDETIVPLLRALESKDEREIVLCVQNQGGIRDLPEDCSVEVPVRVSKKGFRPRAVGNCPRFLRGLFVTTKECDRLTIEAVRHKSYECALQALTINPLAPSVDTAKRYLDRIIKDEQLDLH